MLCKYSCTIHGLSPLVCSVSELASETVNVLYILVGLLERGIGPLQVLCLHRTTQRRKTRTHIRASSGIPTRDLSAPGLSR
jgi:hypothetical protein